VKRALVDSSVLIDYLRALRDGKDTQVRVNVERYLDEHEQLTFSVLTYYEVMRGFIYLDATALGAAFDQMARVSEVIPLDLSGNPSVPVRAGKMWAELTRAGRKMGEVDLLIAATAAGHGRPH